MFLNALGPVVTVVNRVVDDEGKPVPYQAYIDGTVLVIHDQVGIPAGVARIIVHNSMYAIDPETYTGQFRLGVAEWDMPVGPLLFSTISKREELIDRESLPGSRQKVERVRLHNPIRRHDSTSSPFVGSREDGTVSAGYGEAFAK